MSQSLSQPHSYPNLIVKWLGEYFLLITFIILFFKVYCSRYVEGHALDHTEATKHPLALSFADFSVWCYPCNSYIDNEIFEEAKKAAIKSKFGEVVEAKNV